MNDSSDTTESSGAKGAPAVRIGTAVAVVLVTSVAAIVVLYRLADERHFADESAMIAQSYYYTLFRSGQWNHAHWLHYAAYDHPPLPKYLFGLSLDLAGLPVPSSLGPWLNWISGDFSPPADPRVLYWARVPAALFGIGGVVALFFVGLFARGRLFGITAAMLLLANPLYLTHARRAMSDSFAESLVIASVAVGIWGASRLWNVGRLGGWLVFVLLASLTCGWAALAKLNGGVATLIVLSTLVMNGAALLTLPAPSQPQQGVTHGRRRVWNLAAGLFATLAIASGSFAVFVLLNPFLTARPNLAVEADEDMRCLARLGPLDRAVFLVQFRRQWSREAVQQPVFQADRLGTFPDRVRATFYEAFGRYSPLGPRDIRTVNVRGFDRDGDGKLTGDELPGWLARRIELVDRNRDQAIDERELARSASDIATLSQYRRAAALVWCPLVGWGFLCALRHGWSQGRQGESPRSWALVLYAIVALASVVLLIPLNWDRYYLPIQPVASLLVPYGILSTLRWMGSKLTLRPPSPG